MPMWLMLSQKKWVSLKQRSSRVFEKAYMKAATVEIAYSGFKKSGIFPFNRHSDFGLHNQEEVHPTEQDVVEENVPIGTVTGNNRDRENSKENDVPATRVRANDVSALPALSEKPSSGNARSSRRGTAAVITGSPYKDSLKMKKIKRNYV
jgi:hypothetical protein